MWPWWESPHNIKHIRRIFSQCFNQDRHAWSTCLQFYPADMQAAILMNMHTTLHSTMHSKYGYRLFAIDMHTRISRKDFTSEPSNVFYLLVPKDKSHAISRDHYLFDQDKELMSRLEFPERGQCRGDRRPGVLGCYRSSCAVPLQLHTSMNTVTIR